MRPSAERTKREPGAEEYLASVGTTNEGSIETYLTILGSVIERAGKPLLKMTPAEVRKLGMGLKEERSGKHYLRELRRFLRANGARRLLEAVPKSAPRGDRAIGPDDVFSVEEVNRLLEAAASMRNKALYAVSLECGTRVQETLSLNVEGLRRSASGDGTPYYEAYFPEVKVDGEEHYGYVRDPASVEILDEWLASYPEEVESSPRPLFPAFTTSGRGDGRLQPNSANELLKADASRAGLANLDGTPKRAHMHMFKRSCATRLLRQGLPEMTINKIVGWKRNSKMLARYASLDNADVKAALGLAGGGRAQEALVAPARKVPAMAELAFRRNPEKALGDLRAKLEMIEQHTDEWLRVRAKALGLEAALDGPFGPAESGDPAEREAAARDAKD